jgi:DNA-binding transcriptional ArsR family regulator
MKEECKQRVQDITEGFKNCQGAFAAIGDATRQVILLALLDSNLSGVRVGEIAEKSHLTRPSVSHHLKILKEAGIVNVREEGTKNYYYISTNGTKWKEIVDLVNLVYVGIQSISDEKME